MIVIHGGGFARYNKSDPREVSIANHLAENGYLAMVIDYKLWNKSNPDYNTFPKNVIDCVTAVKWLRHNAARFGVDSSKIGVLGTSAGANLAGMVAYESPFQPSILTDVSSKVSVFVDMYGNVDLPNHKKKYPFLNGTRFEQPENYKRASPLYYVTPSAPPTLIFHGTNDTAVSPKQSASLAKALKKNNVIVTHIEIPGAGHSFDLTNSGMDLRPELFKFLEAHLKK